MSKPSLALMIIAFFLGIASLWQDSMTLFYIAVAFVAVASIYEFVVLRRSNKQEQPDYTTNDNQ